MSRSDWNNLAGLAEMSSKPNAKWDAVKWASERIGKLEDALNLLEGMTSIYKNHPDAEGFRKIEKICQEARK